MILRIGVVLGSKGGFLSCSLWKAEWSEMLIRHTSKVAIDWVSGTTHVEPGDSEWYSLTCSYTNQRALARMHENQSSLCTTEQQVLHRQMELCRLEVLMLLHSKNHRPCSCRKRVWIWAQVFIPCSSGFLIQTLQCSEIWQKLLLSSECLKLLCISVWFLQTEPLPREFNQPLREKQ